VIKVEIDDQQVVQGLSRLARAAVNPRTVLDDIGELLIDSTKRRFGTSTGPDGARWAPNSPVTLMRYLSKYKGSFSKDTGRLNQSGVTRAVGKRPLIGETGSLSSNIYKRLEGNSTLHVGSSMVYSAAQQFGMKKGYAGSTRRGSPIPWGDIPARPFLGISDQDRTNILDTISDYLGASFHP